MRSEAVISRYYSLARELKPLLVVSPFAVVVVGAVAVVVVIIISYSGYRLSWNVSLLTSLQPLQRMTGLICKSDVVICMRSSLIEG